MTNSTVVNWELTPARKDEIPKRKQDVPKSHDVLDSLKEYSSWNQGKGADDRITLFDFATFIATPDMLLQYLNYLIQSYFGLMIVVLLKKSLVKKFMVCGSQRGLKKQK
ncbi:MAG: hypothetical protein Q9M92_13705 [Enterobacterales bacterium]|nr:hypothetical protein [Enterobacterales bacterium]